MEAIKKITKKLEQEKDKANSKYIIICKFCKKPIKKVNLIGFSLICPFCKKPQNGEPHLKIPIKKKATKTTNKIITTNKITKISI